MKENDTDTADRKSTSQKGRLKKQKDKQID